MRAIQNINDSFLDFVEHNRYGNAGFYLARFMVLAMAVFVGGKVIAGQFLTFSFEDILFMASAAIAFLLVASRWELGIAMIIATTAFIFEYNAIPSISFYHFLPELKWLEPYRLLVGQGILLFLLALFATSRQVSTSAERLATPLSLAIIAFMFAVLVTSISGVVFNDVPLHYMVDRARPYSYYLTFFVALLCLRDPRRLRILLVILTVMAVIVAIGMILQFFSGDRVRIFIGQGIRVESFGRFAGRILPPGQNLVWMGVTVLVAMIPTLRGKLRSWMLLSLAMVSIGLLLTFTRAMWMGTLAGVLFMLFAGNTMERRGMLRIFLVFALTIFMLLLFLGTVSTQSENYMTAYINRFLSTFQSDSYSDSSTVGARLDEIRAAWPKIMEHPWLGLGIGANYDEQLLWDDDQQFFVWKGIQYLHNTYILILSKTGVLGLSTFILMFGIFFVRARHVFKLVQSPFDRAFTLGTVGTTISVLVAGMLQPDLSAPGPVSILTFLWGSMEFLRYWHLKQLHQDHRMYRLRYRDREPQRHQLPG